ncbi:M61 family metallopeptidase [Emticicia fluvialis]|uniref:M61 family metallopeptidase n=1 Tax=Emticicia fluvialis TaxID=2974474 RepID=UPI002165F697|nr:PDZ domain-containing protein [Emticicia fluvialis]
MKKKSFLLILIFALLSFSYLNAQTTHINYSLSMSRPSTHYFEVSMKLANIRKIKELAQKAYVDFKMPVWTPGSYLMREYAKNVEVFEAIADARKVKAEKINKNTWRVYSNGANEVTVNYKVYAFELSVRTSFLDDTHGYLNGASVFMYVPQLKKYPSTIAIKPYTGWNSISTGLKKVSGAENTFFAPDFDMVVDSPIEIGTHKVLTFEIQNIPHSVAMYSNGPLQYDEQKVTEAYKKVTEAAATVVGLHPCKDYTFIIHHLPGIGGGLEHLNSTTCQTSPNAYASEAGFKGFMGLIAHEYFHLWNVKRIRPIALGPFDYDNENYTHMLWVAEGFTSFYQNHILLRAGLITPKEFEDRTASSIAGIENQPGQQVQSVAEASWDAWIKYYRPNENSANSTISYYNKGGVLGGLINLYIIGETKGQKSLDDVFKLLWSEYYIKQGRGYKDEEFQAACEKVAGKSMQAFFQKYVWSTDAIDYDAFFKYVGLKTVKEYDTKTPFLGVTMAPNTNKIATVLKGASAYDGGLNVNDEILEVDGNKYPVGNYITDKKVGDVVKVKVKRFGREFTYDVTLMANPAAKFKLEKVANPTPEQDMLYKKWLWIK